MGSDAIDWPSAFSVLATISHRLPDVPHVERQRWLGVDVLSYPDRVPTVCDALDLAVTRHPDRIAFEDGGRATSYGVFAELVEGAVATLRAWGVQPGDRVAVAASNCLELAVALFACARGGFTMVGLSTDSQPPRWTTMLRHSRAVVAVAAATAMEGLTRAARDAALTAVHRLEDLATNQKPWSYSKTERPAEDTAYAVVYTSGTTAAPKAAQVVHRPSMHAAHSYQTVVDLRAGDRTAVWFPLTYISAMHAHVLPAMLVGATCVLVSDRSARGYLRVLTQEKITWAYTVPSMWQLLLRRREFAAPKLDHLRVAGFGGSPFPRSSLPRLQSVLRNARLLDVYGLTETHSPATVRLPEDPVNKLGSVGRPLPCMEAICVDDHGRTVDYGVTGHLLLRGSLVTTGYLDDPEATAAAIERGWLRTGDLARIDEDGYVWLVGRTQDIIDRGGRSIYAAEVEELLSAHPDVAEAAVVGVPGRARTETIACVVVPHPGRQPTLAALRRWVAQRLGDHAAPRMLRIADELPRNPTGKLDRSRIASSFE